MNAITATEPAVSIATLEHVLGTGDLSKLTTGQRVEYYRRTCETIGVNPLTRPFRFMSLNGQTVLYATRDLTDQLRNLHKVKISITDKTVDGDLFIVTARATTPDGRQDEDVGAVTIGHLKGDARANAVMKAMTKAKRRVTLSICGLGFTDEAELDTLPGAQTFDADETPPAPIRTAAPPPPPPQRTRGQFLDDLAAQMDTCEDLDAVNRLIASTDVQRARATFQNGHRERLDGIIARGIGAHAPREPAEPDEWADEPADELPPPGTPEREWHDIATELDRVQTAQAHQKLALEHSARILGWKESNPSLYANAKAAFEARLQLLRATA